MKLPLRVLLADDHAWTRADVRAILDADERFEVVAEAADAPGAVRQALKAVPAIALLDVRMPGHGVSAAWEIKARLPGTIVVMFTVSADDTDLFPALRAGAAGYLLKDIDPARLPLALLDVAEGRAAMPRELVTRVLADYRDRDPRRRCVRIEGVREPLTSREWEVLDLLRDGRSTAAMAREMSVSRATVRSHVMSVVRKLGAGDRAEAVRMFAAAQPPVPGMPGTGD